MGQSKTHQPSESNGWSPFNDYVEQRPGVCDQCFSKTHEKIKNYDPTEMKKSLRGVLTEEVEKTEYADGDYKQHSGRGTLHGYSSGFGTKKSTFCKNCGSDRSMTLGGDLPEKMVDDMRKKAYQRVDETDGLYIDKEKMVNEEERLRNDSEENGDDHRRIFRLAVDNTVLVDHSELPDHD